MTSAGILTLGKILILKALDRHVWVDKAKGSYIMENCWKMPIFQSKTNNG